MRRWLPAGACAVGLLGAALFLSSPLYAQNASRSFSEASAVRMRSIAPSSSALRTVASAATPRQTAPIAHVAHPPAQTPSANAAPRAAYNDPYLNGFLNGSAGSGASPFYVNLNNNDDLGVKAFIDPATQMRLATAERLLRDQQSSGVFVPFFYGYGGMAYAPEDQEEPAQTGDQQTPAPQQAPIIIIQQAPQQNGSQPGMNEAPSGESEQPAQSSESSQPDVGAFTLVLRTGQPIQAVAFTRTKDQIVYITADGARHAMASSELDVDATERINQERGTPVQF